VNFIQNFALVGTFWEGFLIDAFFAGAFNQIADFEIIFVFEYFFWHNYIFQYVKILMRSRTNRFRLAGIQKNLPFTITLAGSQVKMHSDISNCATDFSIKY